MLEVFKRLARKHGEKKEEKEWQAQDQRHTTTEKSSPDVVESES